jgi:hypothetical protein
MTENQLVIKELMGHIFRHLEKNLRRDIPNTVALFLNSFDCLSAVIVEDFSFKIYYNYNYPITRAGHRIGNSIIYGNWSKLENCHSKCKR